MPSNVFASSLKNPNQFFQETYIQNPGSPQIDMQNPGSPQIAHTIKNNVSNYGKKTDNYEYNINWNNNNILDYLTNYKEKMHP